VNPKRLGVSGHSFGGQTTLRVAASDARFRAALALAPALVPEDGLVIRAPLMVMTGEIDSLTPFETEAVPSYDLGKGPRLLVEILSAGHCAFIPLCVTEFCGAGCDPPAITPPAANALVLRYGVPFLLRYLKGDRAAGRALRPDAAPDGVVVQPAGATERRRTNARESRARPDTAGAPPPCSLPVRNGKGSRFAI
jgi:predicted dienelactone hydrolase